MTESQHAEITAVMTSQGPYGTGVVPNPYSLQQKEWERRKLWSGLRKVITDKIEALFEPRFITPPETSELIEAIITATDSRRVLELGMCTGFTSLHMLRAIVGKRGAMVVSVDARPAHDAQFFSSPRIAQWFQFVEGWTPDVISKLDGQFDLVFVDSDHSVEHTQKELAALWPLTKAGTIFLFHDVPEWQGPSHRSPPPVRNYLNAHESLVGGCFPTCEQMDCLQEWGEGYPRQCNPGLGIFIRE